MDENNSPIVAKIGDEFITVSEFENSYNSGLSVLKKIGDAKHSYLDAMIHEKMLLHLPEVKVNMSDPFLTKSLELLKQELIVEKMFYVDVDDKIQITDEEIKQALIEDAISINAKYFVTEDKNRAVNLKSYLNSGYDFDSIYNEMPPPLNLLEEIFITDYVKVSDISAPFEKILFSLEVGEYSDIAEIEKNYYILQNIDIKQDIISENDVVTKRKHYKKIISYRKKLNDSKSYVKSVLDKKDISVDGEAFRELVEALYYVYNPTEGGLEKKFIANGIFNEMTLQNLEKNLWENLNKPAVNYSDGIWTVKHLIYQLSIRPLDLRATDKADFAGKLRAAIAIIIRDWFLEQDGIERGYDKDPKITRELDLWKTKLSVQAYIDSLKTKMPVSEKDVKNYYKSIVSDTSSFDKLKEKLQTHLVLLKTRKYLMNKIDSLKLEIPITIYDDLLDSINVDIPKNKPLPDVKLFKLGLPYFRSAFPTPDMVWGII